MLILQWPGPTDQAGALSPTATTITRTWPHRPCSVRMAVMDIAHMRMGMSGGWMAVFMGVPVGAIGVDPFQLLQSVIVLVMEIASPWVVAMAVGMAMAERILHERFGADIRMALSAPATERQPTEDRYQIEGAEAQAAVPARRSGLDDRCPSGHAIDHHGEE